MPRHTGLAAVTLSGLLSGLLLLSPADAGIFNLGGRGAGSSTTARVPAAPGDSNTVEDVVSGIRGQYTHYIDAGTSVSLGYDLADRRNLPMSIVRR
jgi:hypothetical protein